MRKSQPHSRKSRRGATQWVISIVLSVVSIALGLLGFSVLASLKQPPSERPAVERSFNVDVFEVEPVTLQEVVSGFGTARADREVTLAAQVSGEIIFAHERLEEGGRFDGPASGPDADGRGGSSPGETLIVIDPRTYESRVRQIEGRLDELDGQIERLRKEQSNNERLLAKAKKDVERFREEYERVRNLRQRNVTTASSVTTAELELSRYEDTLVKMENEAELFPIRIAQAERTRDATAEELASAKLDEERTVVKAPFNGALCEVYVEQGQYLRAGDQIACLTDPTVVEIPVAITLDDFAKISARIGSASPPEARLAINETDPPRWGGTVVRASPKADSSSRTISVYIKVNNSEQDTPLLPGTFIHARIDGPMMAGAVALPRDAIESTSVYLVKEGRAKRQEIEIERSLGPVAVIADGIEAGDQVLLTNLDAVFDGAAVKPQGSRTLEQELGPSAQRFARIVNE
ncbi:efflux RND transporter periplasmic adaptor subunit [Stratiformator vulcanicus]|uniref:Multidrug resistance protein MdtA n=1 Tax=Stratiformator vulcanicus TaxID=2527980 RepID=A0A517R656_9PLAN|nr:efflux RND transporter periplasmic adaptor subunit [Stratiformator vulcanicus]QDT39350.1 Multidrug resistance protein MdtA precursor [Stratiformator vulcanicus]